MTQNEDENQPLLPGSPHRSNQSDGSDQPRGWRWPAPSIAALRRFLSSEEAPMIICVFFIQFLVSFAKHVVEVPFIRLLETAICNRYYRHQSDGYISFLLIEVIDERLCKITPIQNKLSKITGWKLGLEAIPPLFTAIYYGGLADRYGRRPILAAFSTGTVLSLVWIVAICYFNSVFPIEVVLISPAFLLIGGGQRVCKSMLFTIVADMVGPSHRTRYMYLLSSIPHIVTLVAPPFANLFMRINIWLSYVVAICLLITTFPMIYIMPESIKHIATKPSPTDSAEPSPSTEEEDGLLAPPVEDVQQESHDVPLSWRTCLNPTWFKEITAMVRTPGLLFCFTLFFFDPIALISKAFVYQHASESFSWDLASTTWLRFSQALGASLVTVVALPSLSVILNRRGFRAQKLDLNVIRASLFIAAVGFCVLWQSRSGWMIVAALFICGLSEGLQPALQGLATSLIDRGKNSRMFTTVAVIEVVGKLIGGPSMARLFSIGRSEGHGSKGICFLASSVIFVLLLVTAGVSKVKR